MALPSLHEFAATLDRLAPGMLWVAAGSALVLGLAGLATLAMRRASAAARHEVWLLASAAVLLLPILAATLPSWHILPRLTETNRAPRADETLVEFVLQAGFLPAPFNEMSSAQLPAVPTPDPTLTTHDEKTGKNATSDSPSPTSTSEAVTPPTPSHPVSLTSPSPEANPTPSTSSVRAPWTTWALLCWPIGALLVLCRVLVGHLSLWSLRRRCAQITSGEWFDLLQHLRREVGLRRTVELISSPHRTMPMTWGLWQARLLVPDQAASWPPAQRRDVLLHELGHVRRRDCLAQFLSQLACALYWFNPLAWLAWRRMQLERERACDDLVLNGGAEPPAYARHLLQSITAGPALRLAGAAVAMARPSTLEERMRAILNPRLNRRGLTARGSLAIVLLLTSALLPAAILRAQPTPPQEPSTDSASGRITENARGGGDASPVSPRSPTTRPAGSPQSGRPTFGGARGGGFGGDGGGGGRAFGGTRLPMLGEGPTCTFDATIYDVRIPADQIGRLDVDALAKASQTPEEFEKALSALGTTRPMYRANQSVRLSGDTITIGSEVPIVTNSRLTDRGQAINSVQYQSVGAIFAVVGLAGAPGGIDADLGIEVSAASDTGTAVSDTVRAPIMRKATMSHKGPFQPRKPFVILSVDAGAPDKDGKAVAFICRVIMGEPQPSAPR